MSNFKEYLSEDKTLNEEVLKIALEDGDMVVKSEEDGDNYKLNITYNGNKCNFISLNGGSAIKGSGDIASCLNALIQQFYMDGTVKSN